MEKRCQMQHVGQTNENVSLSISLFSCKFKIIKKSPPPPNTFAICKEIKNNTGYPVPCMIAMKYIYLSFEGKQRL